MSYYHVNFYFILAPTFSYFPVIPSYHLQLEMILFHSGPDASDCFALPDCAGQHVSAVLDGSGHCVCSPPPSCP